MNNNKIKLIIFHPYSKIGGADLSLSRLINNLNKDKYDIDFVSISRPGIKNYITNKKIKYIKINSSRLIFSFFKLKKYLNIQKNKKYKKFIFFSNQHFANVFTLMLLKKFKWIKFLVIERNHLDEFKFYKNFYQLIINIIIKNLIRLLYKKADLIIGISKKLSQDLQGLCKAKVVTIYNPSFDKKIFLKTKNVKKYKNNKKIILSVGRLENQKDHMTLLKAFNICKNETNAKLIIIGYGSNFNNLTNYINNNFLNNRVKILTNIKNPYPFYKNADLFILSSLYEGFGNVLIEAGMFRVPIISSNCNAGPKEILSNSKGGELFNVGNEIQLSKKIMLVLNKNYKNKSNYLYKSLKRFETNNIVKKYNEIFSKI
jgi:glycosyltransferase involved in cell wall biosynthesis